MQGRGLRGSGQRGGGEMIITFLKSTTSAKTPTINTNTSTTNHCITTTTTKFTTITIFACSPFSKHRPSGPMLSISRNVHISVCLFVCLSVCSLLRYRLTVFLPPLLEVGCPIFLEIRNPWGKVLERSGLRIEHFYWEVV